MYALPISPQQFLIILFIAFICISIKGILGLLKFIITHIKLISILIIVIVIMTHYHAINMPNNALNLHQISLIVEDLFDPFRDIINSIFEFR